MKYPGQAPTPKPIVKPKHIHIYQRFTKTIFRCIVPECTHSINVGLLVGRIAMCPYCAETFSITPEHLRRKKVHCMKCGKEAIREAVSTTTAEDLLKKAGL